MEGKKGAWKLPGKKQWGIVFLLGLLLVVLALPSSTTDGKSTTTQNTREESDLEAQLAEMLEKVEGVGNVKVMLYTEESGSTFSSDNRETIQGVLIVAEGGSDPDTVLKIQQAVMALFQVEAHKIKVMKMK